MDLELDLYYHSLPTRLSEFWGCDFYSPQDPGRSWEEPKVWSSRLHMNGGEVIPWWNSKSPISIQGSELPIKLLLLIQWGQLMKALICGKHCLGDENKQTNTHAMTKRQQPNQTHQCLKSMKSKLSHPKNRNRIIQQDRWVNHTFRLNPLGWKCKVQ